jgi:hypothetical protein
MSNGSGDRSTVATSTGSAGGTVTMGGGGGSEEVSDGPGCPLQSMAFCDTFDAPSTNSGRAGELDAKKWSAGRFLPQLPTGGANVFPIGPAAISGCRAGLPAQVFPDQDTLICDASQTIASPHLLAASAAQNYGINSYRIRQPFDFAGRMGTIVFDADAAFAGGGPLIGWISVEITEDPIAVPSYAFEANNEGGILPKNGLEIQFSWPCGQSPPTKVSVDSVHVFQNYVDNAQPQKDATAGCVPIQSGHLQRFKVQISQQHVEVYGTPFSSNGAKFPATQKLIAADVNLPFTRGYVHISVHNHASLKYSNNMIEAAVVAWDNVGFDGPMVSNWREYEAKDSLTSGTFQSDDPNNPAHKAVNVGYLTPEVGATNISKLVLHGVDPSGADTARLAVSAWYPSDDGLPFETFTLRYRFNGKTWHDHVLSPEEAAIMKAPTVTGVTGIHPHTLGGLGHVLDVDLADLVPGDNTLEFATANVPQNYPPAVANIDLVLSTP